MRPSDLHNEDHNIVPHYKVEMISFLNFMQTAMASEGLAPLPFIQSMFSWEAEASDSSPSFGSLMWEVISNILCGHQVEAVSFFNNLVDAPPCEQNAKMKEWLWEVSQQLQHCSSTMARGNSSDMNSAKSRALTVQLYARTSELLDLGRNTSSDLSDFRLQTDKLLTKHLGHQQPSKAKLASVLTLLHIAITQLVAERCLQENSADMAALLTTAYASDRSVSSAAWHTAWGGLFDLDLAGPLHLAGMGIIPDEAAAEEMSGITHLSALMAFVNQATPHSAELFELLCQHALDRGPVLRMDQVQDSEGMPLGSAAARLNQPAGRNGETPLTCAAYSGSTTLAEVIIDYGAKVNVPRMLDAARPLDLAVHHAHATTALALLRHGADVLPDPSHLQVMSLMEPEPALWPEMLLLNAVQCSEVPANIQLVHELLAQWVPLEEVWAQTGETALLMAVNYDDVEMVELLVAAGAAVDVTPGTTSNRTPLVEAAVKGNVAMMDILLGAGAKVDYMDRDTDYNLVQAAANKGHFEAVVKLVEAGANWRVGSRRLIDGSVYYAPDILTINVPSLKLSFVEGRLKLAEKLHKKRREAVQASLAPLLVGAQPSVVEATVDVAVKAGLCADGKQLVLARPAAAAAAAAGAKSNAVTARQQGAPAAAGKSGKSKAMPELDLDDIEALAAAIDAVGGRSASPAVPASPAGKKKKKQQKQKAQKQEKHLRGVLEQQQDGQETGEPDRQQRVSQDLQQIENEAVTDDELLGVAKVKKCVVCMERLRNVLLLPCKHMVLCRECAEDLDNRQALQQCPYCRQLCAKVVKTAKDPDPNRLATAMTMENEIEEHRSPRENGNQPPDQGQFNASAKLKLTTGGSKASHGDAESCDMPPAHACSTQKGARTTLAPAPPVMSIDEEQQLQWSPIPEDGCPATDRPPVVVEDWGRGSGLSGLKGAFVTVKTTAKTSTVKSAPTACSTPCKFDEAQLAGQAAEVAAPATDQIVAGTQSAAASPTPAHTGQSAAAPGAEAALETVSNAAVPAHSITAPREGCQVEAPGCGLGTNSSGSGSLDVEVRSANGLTPLHLAVLPMTDFQKPGCLVSALKNCTESKAMSGKAGTSSGRALAVLNAANVWQTTSTDSSFYCLQRWVSQGCNGRSGNLSIVQLLLEHGANAAASAAEGTAGPLYNEGDMMAGTTPLHLAACLGRDVTALMMQQQPQQEAEHGVRSAATAFATAGHHVDSASHITALPGPGDARAAIQVQPPPAIDDSCCSVEDAANGAVEGGSGGGIPGFPPHAREQCEIIRALVQAGADVDAGLAGSGDTPLTVAAISGSVVATAALLTKGVLPDQPRSLDGWRPLDMALHAKHFEVALLLLKQGATAKRADAWVMPAPAHADSTRNVRMQSASPSLAASNFAVVGIYKECCFSTGHLLQQPPSTAVADSTAGTAAALKARGKAVANAAGPSVGGSAVAAGVAGQPSGQEQEQSKQQQPPAPAIVVSVHGDQEPALLVNALNGASPSPLVLVQLLLAAGAPVDAVDPESGGTALLWAIIKKLPQVVAELVSCGADVSIPWRQGKEQGVVPLVQAAMLGDEAIIQTLAAAGADLSAMHPSLEYNAVQCAAISGHLDAVLLLVKLGASWRTARGAGMVYSVPHLLRCAIRGLQTTQAEMRLKLAEKQGKQMASAAASGIANSDKVRMGSASLGTCGTAVSLSCPAASAGGSAKQYEHQEELGKQHDSSIADASRQGLSEIHCPQDGPDDIMALVAAIEGDDHSYSGQQQQQQLSKKARKALKQDRKEQRAKTEQLTARLTAAAAAAEAEEQEAMAQQAAAPPPIMSAIQTQQKQCELEGPLQQLQHTTHHTTSSAGVAGAGRSADACCDASPAGVLQQRRAGAVVLQQKQRCPKQETKLLSKKEQQLQHLDQMRKMQIVQQAPMLALADAPMTAQHKGPCASAKATLTGAALTNMLDAAAAALVPSSSTPSLGSMFPAENVPHPSTAKGLRTTAPYRPPELSAGLAAQLQGQTEPKQQPAAMFEPALQPGLLGSQHMSQPAPLEQPQQQIQQQQLSIHQRVAEAVLPEHLHPEPDLHASYAGAPGLMQQFLQAQLDISQLADRTQALQQIRVELQSVKLQANLVISSQAAAGAAQLLQRLPSVKRRLTALHGKGFSSSDIFASSVVCTPAAYLSLVYDTTAATNTPHKQLRSPGAVALGAAKGIDAIVASLAAQLKAPCGPSTGVKGLLLHGMGGIGKSTLAHQLAVALQDQQLYQGGVLKVVLQPQLSPSNPQFPRADEFLRQAQRDLLQQLTDRKQAVPRSLDEGAGQLREAFAGSDSVLLLVDNVPEDSSGIRGMLPSLDKCLPPGWVSAVDLHKVEPLPPGPSAQILQAAGLQSLLDRQQLCDVLAYCGGLPLALTVIGGFLADDATRAGVLQDIHHSLNTKKAVGVGDVQEDLVVRLRTSVNLLQRDLRSTWLDIAMLFSDGSVSWGVLEMVYGHYQMNNLLVRNLVTKVIKGGASTAVAVPEIHHVLLTVANEMCRPGTPEYRICEFNWRQVPDPLPAGTEVAAVRLRGHDAGSLEFLDRLPVQLLEHARVLDVDVEGGAMSSPFSFPDWLFSSSLSFSSSSSSSSAPAPPPPAVSCWCVKAISGPLKNLLWLYLKGMGSLQQLLDGQLRALRYLNLSDCRCLQQIPDAFGQLEALQYLNLSGCSSLQQLPDTFGQLSALQYLDLSACESLLQLPDAVGKLSALKQLFLSCCSLQQLPDTFGSLGALHTLYLGYCRNLQQLPSTFGKLSALLKLDLLECSSLRQLPDTFGQLKNLQKLHLNCRSLQRLPDGFGQLCALKELDVADCSSLQLLPDSLQQMSALQKLHLDCSSLQKLPDSFGQLHALQELIINDCNSLQQLPNSFGMLSCMYPMPYDLAVHNRDHRSHW
eukprot:gene4639-4892_t